MNKHLLIDCIPFEFSRQTIAESLNQDPNRPLVVKGVLQRAEAKNQNGRVYPYDVLVREAQKYADEFIKERRALGELDHPSSEIVELKNASHNIIGLHWEGKDLIGTIEVLPTPSGNILKELFKANIRLGISSRGMGTVEKDIREGLDVVQDDYSIICWDFVSNPSVKGSFMYPINEGHTTVKNPVTNKWEKVEDLVREILSSVG